MSLSMYVSFIRDGFNDGHKKCAMDSMVKHIRVHAFDNGRYLRNKNLTSPNGFQIDQSLLRIRQVRQKLSIDISYNELYNPLWLVGWIVPLCYQSNYGRFLHNFFFLNAWLAFFSRVLRNPTRLARDFGGSVSGLDYMCIGNMYLPIGLIGFSVYLNAYHSLINFLHLFLLECLIDFQHSCPCLFACILSMRFENLIRLEKKTKRFCTRTTWRVEK